MQSSDRAERALGLLGLATRAGRVTVGVPLICTAMQQGKNGQRPLVVLTAADASAATKKRIGDKCAFYGVQLIALPVDCGRLALAVGKRGAAVAAAGVNEPNLATAIKELYNI
ncbi:MAG: hypothetical protein IKM08_07175 [Clostridia bacterium]|nr:hypothetical protein [Clostridia bacterium]